MKMNWSGTVSMAEIPIEFHIHLSSCVMNCLYGPVNTEKSFAAKHRVNNDSEKMTLEHHETTSCCRNCFSNEKRLRKAHSATTVTSEAAL
jgi:hypothetical protein